VENPLELNTCSHMQSSSCHRRALSIHLKKRLLVPVETVFSDTKYTLELL